MSGPAMEPGDSDPAVRGYAHETSLPLLLLGAVVCVSMAARLVWPYYDSRVIVFERVSGPLPAFVTDVGITVVFAVLWLALRRRVARDEGRSAAGFAAVALVGMILALTPFWVLLFTYGPFTFGLGLFIGGYKMDDPVLIAWAVIMGVAAFIVDLHIEWNNAVAYLLLGLITIIAGAVVYVWETRKSKVSGL